MNLHGEVRYKDKDFIVGNGTIMTYDTCIPLHAVSVIKVRDKIKKPIANQIIILILGGIIQFVPLLSFIGLILVLYGVLSLAIRLWENYMQKYALVIQVHAGGVYIFEHKDVGFLRKIADIIRQALDDSASVTYIDMRRTSVKQNFKGGSSFYSFGENNSFGPVITGTDTTYNEGSHDTIISGNTSITITVDEWDKLERYFKTRGEELGRDHQAYPACKELEKYARKRDAKGMCEFLKSVGKGVLTAVLAKATESGLAEVFRKVATAVL